MLKFYQGARDVITLLAVCAGVCVTAKSEATPQVYVGSGSGISASVIFTDLGGGNLKVELDNTYTGDTPNQASVLTAVFFSGLDGLHPVSANLPSGSLVWTDESSVASGGLNVGGEWAYLDGLAGPGGGTAGISSSGLGLFGNGNFNGPNIDPPANGALDGSGYGIISSGYAGTSANGNLGGRSYVQNSVVFILSGFNGDLSSLSHVTFQYGTAIGSAPSFSGILIPEPNSIALLPLAALAFLRRRMVKAKR
jgi:hypothetical protein